MTVIVRKLGGSVAVVIPKGVARGMDLVEGTSLEISSNAEGIMLRKQGIRPRRAIGEIVAQIKPSDYRRRNREMPEGHAVGKEIW